MMEPVVRQYPPTEFPGSGAPTAKQLSAWSRLRLWATGNLPQPRTSPDRLPAYPTNQAAGITILGTQAPLAWHSDANTYRMWSLTPWIRAAIKIRREQIASADWDIVQLDSDGPKNVRLAKRIRNLIDSPNARNDSFHSFAQELLEDILVLDAGAAEKVRYPDGELAQMWPTPGEFIAVNPGWDGSDIDAPRYFYIPDGQVRATFRNSDMMYMIDNPRTFTPLGISPIEVLGTIISSELANQHYNRRQVLGAAPDGVLNIGESAQGNDVQAAKAEWEQKLAEGGAMQIIGGFKGVAWMPFRSTNRDMQFREWEDLLLRCIAVVYGLSPMDLGITFDVNRSTANAQQQNTEDRGQRPLLDLFQRYMTRNIVWDESFGGKENNLAFRFSALNLNETQQKAEINKVALGGAPWKTVNEARLMDGRQPLGDLDDKANIFNHVLLMTPKGMLDLTDEKYLGEEQLAQIALDSQTALVTAEANAQPKEEPPPAAAAKGLTTEEWTDQIRKSVPDYTHLIDQQVQLTKTITEIASRPINVEVHPPTVEVHPPNVDVQPAKIEFLAGAITTPAVTFAPPNIEVSVPAPQVTIEKGAVQVQPPAIQVDVHVPEGPAPSVTVNTPDELSIRKMPTRVTTRTVTKRGMDGVAEIQDVESDQ